LSLIDNHRVLAESEVVRFIHTAYAKKSVSCSIGEYWDEL
jgi:hypothetical protein